MKRSLTFLSLLITTFAFGQSSVYKPFCKQPQWSVGGTNFGITWYGNYAYEKDTTIGLYTYEKIISVGSPQYFNLFREDSLQKKVYQYNLINSVDSLFIDFTLAPGATFNITGAPSTGTVTSRDSVLIYGAYHNRINFSVTPGPNYSFVEGILSEVNPLTGRNNNGGDPMEFLVCMCQNNVFYYQNLVGGTFTCNLSCTPNTASISIHPLSFDIDVYPNPTSDVMKVMRDGNEEKMPFYIADALGNIVKEGVLTNETSIDVKYIPDGIYSINSRSPKGFASKKIAIIH